VAQPFTPKQGRYLAFIHWYTKINGRPPAEADIQRYFKTSPAAIHQMIVSLEGKGLIQRIPGQARSIQILIPAKDIPDLDTGEPSPSKGRFKLSAYPNIAEWIDDHEGHIEVGYDYNTDTFVRALDEGGMLWGGGERSMTLEEGLLVLDTAIAERRKQWQ